VIKRYYEIKGVIIEEAMDGIYYPSFNHQTLGDVSYNGFNHFNRSSLKLVCFLSFTKILVMGKVLLLMSSLTFTKALNKLSKK
jgi:hypothetical protein